MTADRQFLDERKSLACVHCGLCLSACPTYLETGNENESPRGRIYIMRALQAGRLEVDDSSAGHIDRCLGCRACETACPSGVGYGVLLEQTREFLEERRPRSLREAFLRRVAIERLFPVPWRMRLALAPARWAKRLRLERLLPGSFREALSLVPDQLVADRTPERSPAWRQPAKGVVGFVRGCAMSVMFGNTNASSIRLLNAVGFDVVSPSDQVCCGALFAHNGRLALAREHARRNLDAFNRHSLDYIIINAAGCGSTLKEYGHLLHADGAREAEATAFSARVRDLTEFLADEGLIQKQFRRSSERVTYHDACHLAHPQQITAQPRQLIRAVAGNNFVELAESDLCCGSAGTYNLTQPEMAGALQARKIENILRTRAATVITTNPGCILQISAGLKKAGGLVRVMHIADYLSAALPEHDQH